MPTDVYDFVVPDVFMNSLRGEKFLCYDYNENNKRILLYTTDENLSILKKCRTWQVDGTFSTVPGISNQLYTLHGRYKKNLVPLVYALTTDRTEETYILILNKLCELKSGLNPQFLVVDFELGFMNAFEDVFSDCVIHGCFFHWGQCVMSKVSGCQSATKKIKIFHSK